MTKTMNGPATIPAEQVLPHAYDEAPVGLCYFDTDLRYLHINKWLAQLNGLPVEKHLGRTIHEVIPRVAAGVADQLRQVLETSTPILEGMVEAETPARPGVPRTFMHNYLPVVADDGRVIGVSCLVQDVTARRAAEVGLEARTAELEQTNRDLRLVLDNLTQLNDLRQQKKVFDALTSRQREVLRLLGEGSSMKEAATALCITPRTIAFHKYRIMEKLGIDTSAELVQFAIKRGLIRI